MTADEVRKLPIAEKILIMEAIWDDFRERFEQAEDFDIPEEHKQLLDERMARIKSGEEPIYSLEEVKARLERL